jgi:hypothetical protein
MALRQVFVSTDADLQAASAPDYFTDLSSGVVGIWNHAGATGTGAWHTAALYQNTADLTDDDSGESLTAIAQSIPLVSSFQVAMGYGSGNPIGSPIIRAGDLIDVTYTSYNAAVKEVVAFDVSGTTVAIGDVGTVKLQVRYTGEPSTYDAQINPSGETIGNAFSQIVEQSQKVFNVEFVATAATAANLVTGLAAAVNAHGVLKELVTAANASNDLQLTSKINGLHVVGQFLLNGTKIQTSAVTTVGEMGAGNYYQVIGEEKKSRLANAGNFNRLYLPETVTTFAASGTAYDRISIRYANRLPAHVFGGGQPSVSEVVIYYPDTATGGDNDFEEVFPHTPGTNSVARFSGALGSNTALNL